MRSLSPVLRSLAALPLPRKQVPAPPAGPEPRRRVSFEVRNGPALDRLEVERVEALLRRFQGRPARIDNPFAAFPTRSFWLGRLMRDGA